MGGEAPVSKEQPRVRGVPGHRDRGRVAAAAAAAEKKSAVSAAAEVEKKKANPYMDEVINKNNVPSYMRGIRNERKGAENREVKEQKQSSPAGRPVSARGSGPS